MALCGLGACAGSDDEAPADVPVAPDVPVSPPDPVGPIHFFDASERLAISPTESRGVGLVDFDGDGAIDVSVTEEHGVRLYRNLGGGDLEALDVSVPLDRAQGVTWVDVDADGDLDLYATSIRGTNRLMRNDGGGAFTDVTDEAGLGDDGPSAGASFGDLDGDGDLDLLLCQAARSPDDPLRRQPAVRGNTGAPNVLYLNDGKGRFEPGAAGPLAGPNGGESFTAALFDRDRDGDLDVFVAHDFSKDQLLENTGGGVFEDRSAALLPSGETSIMGVVIGDIDGDGLLDIYGTDNNTDKLYLGTSAEYVDVQPAWVAEDFDSTQALTGWGNAMVDLDNDGRADVVGTSSFSDPGDFTGGVAGVTRRGRMVLLQQVEGPRFVDITFDAGLVMDPSLDGWGLAAGDIDDDGDIDLLVGAGIAGTRLPADAHDTPLLLINDGYRATQNGWLQLDLRDPGSKNPFAVGAEVAVIAHGIRSATVVRAGTSYLSQHAYRRHFGLGPYTRVPIVEVVWPGGERQRWIGLETGRHTLERRAGGGCCRPDGTCTDDPDCAQENIAGLLDLDAECLDACENLSACGYLIDSGQSRAGCEAACRALPPSKSTLQCSNQKTCDFSECDLKRYPFSSPGKGGTGSR